MSKDLNDFIKLDKKFEQIKFISQFPSKKNLVGLVNIHNKTQVVKWFQPCAKKQFLIEQHQLSLLSKKNLSPQLYEIDNKHYIIFMEHIQGKNLCEMINDPHIHILKKEQALFHLVHWFLKFHTLLSNDKGYIIHGDAHLKNFIINTSIIGLDFEESKRGSPYQDIASLCVSILATDPMFTDEKIKLSHYIVNKYINNYPENQERFQPYFSSSMNQVIKRRKNNEKLKNAYQESDKENQLYFDNDSIR